MTFASRFIVRPLALVSAVAGLLVPLVAILARPRKFFFGALLYLFILLALPGGVTLGWGTRTTTETVSTYGWPCRYLTIRCDRGGHWSPGKTKWIPYETHHIRIAWRTVVVQLVASLAGAFLLTASRERNWLWPAHHSRG